MSDSRRRDRASQPTSTPDRRSIIELVTKVIDLLTAVLKLITVAFALAQTLGLA